MCHCLQRSHDAFSVRVHSCVVFEPPLDLASSLRTQTQVWAPHAVCDSDQLRGHCAGCQEELGAAAMQRALGVTAEDWSRFMDSPLCLPVPSAILFLICKGD